MIKVLRIGHATFETPDLAKAIEHYTQVIGLSLAGREDKRAFLATKIGQLAIELRQGSETRCSKLSFEVAPNVAFVTPEPKALAEFYEKVLGFRVSDWIGDFFVFMRCNADHHSVNFIHGKSAKMHHIAYELRDFSHLQTACDLFGERKIPIIWGPVRLGPGHNVAAFHRDHDDWVVELYTELDQMKDEELGYFD